MPCESSAGPACATQGYHAECSSAASLNKGINHSYYTMSARCHINYHCLVKMLLVGLVLDHPRADGCNLPFEQPRSVPSARTSNPCSNLVVLCYQWMGVKIVRTSKSGRLACIAGATSAASSDWIVKRDLALESRRDTPELTPCKYLLPFFTVSLKCTSDPILSITHRCLPSGCNGRKPIHNASGSRVAAFSGAINVKSTDSPLLASPADGASTTSQSTGGHPYFAAASAGMLNFAITFETAALVPEVLVLVRVPVPVRAVLALSRAGTDPARALRWTHSPTSVGPHCAAFDVAFSPGL